MGQEIKINGQQLIATEKNSSTCAGAEGELPVAVRQQEKNDYVDFSAPDSVVYRLKYFPDRIEGYKGKWIDVFELRQA